MKTIPNNNYISKVTTIFKLLSDPTRFKILYLLNKSKDGLCVYEIADAIPVSHSAASHQLSKLEDRGIVNSFKEGQSVCYRLNESPVTKEIIHIIKNFKES